jgi:hypothetical protein
MGDDKVGQFTNKGYVGVVKDTIIVSCPNCGHHYVLKPFHGQPKFVWDETTRTIRAVESYAVALTLVGCGWRGKFANGQWLQAIDSKCKGDSPNGPELSGI